jgi:hypothetical protein
MAGCAYSENGHEQAGMGVGVADYDCDGWFDIFKTNFADDTCNLYHNNGDGTFSDVTFASGIGINNQYVAWGCGFVDYDNDGWADIIQVNGHVYPEIAGHAIGQQFKNPRLVYKNLGNGQFKDVSSSMGPGINERYSSRGAAFGDFDNDGDIDVLVLNMNDVPSLLRNQTGGDQVQSHRDRRAGTRCNRESLADRRGSQRIECNVAKRFASSLRFGQGTNDRRDGSKMAHHSEDRAIHAGKGQSDPYDSRR